MAALVVQSVRLLACAEIQQHLQNRGRMNSPLDGDLHVLSPGVPELCLVCVISNPPGQLGPASRSSSRKPDPQDPTATTADVQMS